MAYKGLIGEDRRETHLDKKLYTNSEMPTWEGIDTVLKFQPPVIPGSVIMRAKQLASLFKETHIGPKKLSKAAGSLEHFVKLVLSYHKQPANLEKVQKYQSFLTTMNGPGLLMLRYILLLILPYFSAYRL